jgi:DNA processing protein
LGTPREVRRGGEGYPERLASLRGMPSRLFVDGGWDHEGRVVAVVGSREATGDGLDFAHALAADLAASGVAVISGMARGIDAAAHEGALRAGGRSGAVLGTSLGDVYPPEHRELQARLASSLGILSLLPPGTRATKRSFASRNRVLAGLADAVVVVQGQMKTGARRTADAAREFGRILAVVPWDVSEPFGEAPLDMLVRGEAKPIRHAEDLLRLLAGAPSRALAEVALRPARALESARRRAGGRATTRLPIAEPLAVREKRLLAALRNRREPLEAAAARCSLSLADAGAAFVVLELLGLAERTPGGFVRRLRVPG